MIADTISLAFQLDWPEAEVISTRLGEEGLELVESESPDAVILDLGLPDMSGFEVLKRIRLSSEVPVVILSAMSDESDIAQALDYGADQYITKPFNLSELSARVKTLASRG